MKSEMKVNFKIILGICFIGLLLLFTFTDLPIAKMVYHPNSLFGWFFEIIGTLPMPVVGIFSCIALIGTAKRKLCIQTVLSYLLGISLLLYFAFYCVLCIVYALSITLIPMIIAIVIWIVLSIFFTKKIIDNGNRENLRKAAIIGVSCCSVAVIGVSILKNIMGRPRFYTLSNADTQFTYWFLRQPPLRNSSFPSGHAAQSAVTFCSLLIPALINIKNIPLHKRIALLSSTAFTLCVMFSRMVLGMHYATDVLVGAALTIATLLILESLLKFPKIYQKQEKC